MTTVSAVARATRTEEVRVRGRAGRGAPPGGQVRPSQRPLGHVGKCAARAIGVQRPAGKAPRHRGAASRPVLAMAIVGGAR